MVKKIPELTDMIKQEIAREFEDAVTEVLISKAHKALETYGARTLILGGGVIANTHIRREFEKYAKENDTELLIPELKLTTDNALMIAIAGYFHTFSKNPPLEWESVRATGNLRLSFQSLT